MPSIYQLKPAFQNLLRPLVKGLHGLGFTANIVTLLAMFISVTLALFIYFYFSNHPTNVLLLLFPLWMLLRMAFNAIDGMLAREFNQQSDLGAYFNELCDVISDTALFLCFLTFSFIEPVLLFSVVFLALLTEYTGVMAPLIQKHRRYDGPMGKSDRAFYFSVLAILIYSFSFFSNNLNLLSNLSNGLLIIMSLLLILTIYNRIKNSLRAENIRNID